MKELTTTLGAYDASSKEEVITPQLRLSSLDALSIPRDVVEAMEAEVDKVFASKVMQVEVFGSDLICVDYIGKPRAGIVGNQDFTSTDKASMSMELIKEDGVWEWEDITA